MEKGPLKPLNQPLAEGLNMWQKLQEQSGKCGVLLMSVCRSPLRALLRSEMVFGCYSKGVRAVGYRGIKLSLDLRYVWWKGPSQIGQTGVI